MPTPRRRCISPRAARRCPACAIRTRRRRRARGCATAAFARYSVRLAEVDGEIVGFAARDGAWLMQLYVKPGLDGTRHRFEVAGGDPCRRRRRDAGPQAVHVRAQRGRPPLLRTTRFRRRGVRRRDGQRGGRARRPLRALDAGVRPPGRPHRLCTRRWSLSVQRCGACRSPFTASGTPRIAARMPCSSAVGVGGQPGISTSTGMTLATRPREA